MSGYYETAQICLGGHVITDSLNSSALAAPRCVRCGEPTVTACESCHQPIRGDYHVPGVFVVGGYVAPRYCWSCGEPYPWTASALSAADEGADLMDKLSAQEREDLKRDLADLIKESPRAPVAAVRFRRAMLKAGAEAPGLFKEIFVGVVSNVVLKQMGLG